MNTRTKTSVKKSLDNELKSLPAGFIVTLISSMENYASVNKEILEYFINKQKMTGIYVTMNKPYETLKTSLARDNIDSKKLFFIDAISATVGKQTIKTAEMLSVQNPSALTEISIGIAKVAKAKKYDFLIMDSLTTMLVYNTEETTLKFMHYLTNLIRQYKLSGVILSLEDDMEKKTLRSIVQFCDSCIKI
jgi:archaellum biogenesis ATPase FlaH